jgi:hypothetical protein
MTKRLLLSAFIKAGEKESLKDISTFSYFILLSTSRRYLGLKPIEILS